MKAARIATDFSVTAERVRVLFAIAAIVAAAVVATIIQGGFPVSDNAMFEYIGRAVLHGHVLYRDVWDTKLPPVYYVNAFWQWSFGENYRLHAVAEACIGLASIGLFALIGRSFGLRYIAPASVVLAIMLLLVSDLNSVEMYALPLLLAAVLASRYGKPLLCGIFIVAATTFWIPAVALTIPAAILLGKKHIPAFISAVVAGIVILLALMLVFAGSSQFLNLLRSWPAYVSSLPAPPQQHHHFPILNRIDRAYTAFSNFCYGMIDSGAAVLLAILVAAIRKPSDLAQRFGIVWCACMLLATCGGTRFYSQYFVPLLPALLFTTCAFLVDLKLTRVSVVMLVLAAIFVVPTFRDTSRYWIAVSQRSSLSERIGSALRPVMKQQLSMESDTYKPDLYLSVEPRLRSQYEIVAPSNSFAENRLSMAPPPDITVITTGESDSTPRDRGIPICTRIASPWRIFASRSVSARFASCD